MEEIKIMPKPAHISWDTIHDILYKAHESNRQKGVDMKTAYLSGEELKKRVGREGQCFVAILGNKIVGTASVRFYDRNCWYHRGKIADFMLVGILPEYKGKGIYSMLSRYRDTYIRNLGCNVVELDTAEGNTNMISISKKYGFQIVGIKASPYTEHYSVIMVKWLEKCPYTKCYVKTMSTLQMLKYRLIYKRGHIRRF